MSSPILSICSISWIDRRNLPEINTLLTLGAIVGWTNRVIIGLVGTSNPPPPTFLDVPTFRDKKHYRSLATCTVSVGPRISVTDAIIDSGWTLPVDKRELPFITSLGGSRTVYWCKKGLQPSAAADKANGAITKHAYAVGPGKPITAKLRPLDLPCCNPTW